MENLESNNPIIVNDEIKQYFLETTKWAKFLSIIGFIGIGFILIAAIFMILAGGSAMFSGFSMLIGILYIIIAIVYFFPVKYLYQFSKNIQEGIHFNDQQSFAFGLKKLKSHYKCIGILTIITICIYILALIGVLLFSSMLFKSSIYH